MFIDEDLPKKPRALFTPAPLDTVSVAEMQEYIGLLRAEITRTEAEIMRRGAHKDAAKQLFK
jgi:uncharacterized small protein (DUF1192 family)